MSKLSLLLSALALSGSLLSQTKPGTAAAQQAAYESVINDPLNARIYTLKNGLKVYLSVYKDAPRIQTYIAVKAGSKNDPATATGLAHYLEHMVFKGTDVYGTKDFQQESRELAKIEALFEAYRKTSDEAARKTIYHQIDSISGVAAKYAIANEYDKMMATIGASGTNAYTSFDQTVYVNEIPSNQIDNWLKIEAERFRKPVLRLFHTELEAVYEEKNRGLDNDDNKIWEAVFAGLFRNHTYGTQTTIGTIEHLKNPSMTEISRYYQKHYVPNNMAIIMSGDFDPDQVMAGIEKHFGGMTVKKVEPYTFTPEQPIREKVVKNIVGPNPESVSLAWRFAGEGSKDADLCAMLSGMLYNGTAGLMDLNLNQGQKVLSSFSFHYPMKDYSMFVVGGEPKEGQSLEQVEALLLSQLELIKKGDFPAWLMDAVTTDLRLRKTKELEKNSTRADAMLAAFVNDIKWQDYVNSLERLSKISKQELMYFANKSFSQKNYVVAYKRTGEDSSVVKVQKPEITPVEVDRDNISEFSRVISSSTTSPIEPRFIDYDKDIVRSNMHAQVPFLYTSNAENRLFELYYKFDFGSNDHRIYPVAVKFIPFLATKDMTPAQVKQEFYKLGCSFNVFIDEENTWVSLSGLSDNFDKAHQLFERLLNDPQVDENTFKNMIGDLIKERNDNKLQKRIILNRAMLSYARYGPQNPFSNVLSDEDLMKIPADSIRATIAGLISNEHKVLYYGPQSFDEIGTKLRNNHVLPARLTPAPSRHRFAERALDRTVYVVDYPMKQVEIMMVSNGTSFDPEKVPLISLYNNYFGGNISSIVFQDLRESKALAYSTFSRYYQPNKLSKKYFNLSYIGSQADKLSEALDGLSSLLNDMPKAEGTFASAREMLLQETRSQRISRSALLFNYLSAQDLGLQSDIRKNIFEKAPAYSMDDIKRFHENEIKGKPTSILVLGKKESLDISVLQKYGTVKYLTLEEVFGF